MLSERARERDRDKEKSSRTTIFNFHVRGMSDIFEPANGDRVHSDGRAELLDNAAGGIEIGEAGMLIPRNMRGPACPALLPRPLLPPSSRLPAYPPLPSPPRIHVSIARPCRITRFFSNDLRFRTSSSRFPIDRIGDLNFKIRDLIRENLEKKRDGRIKQIKVDFYFARGDKREYDR